MSRPVIDVPNLPKISPKAIGLGILALLVFLTLNGLWYQVPAESEAVKLRFGKLIEEGIKPGLHYKLPLGIDRVQIEPVQRQLKLEFGFTTPGATSDLQYGARGEEENVKNMVTGDLNSAHVEWVVQYRIIDLPDYLFNVREAGATLRDVSESVMREIVGDRTVDEVLTVGRLEIETEALGKMNKIAKLYELGLAIDQVQLKGVNPPPAVRSSFDEVNRAQQEREQLINVAKGEYNKAVPRAKGEADQKLSEAEGDALKRINESTGDAARFKSIFTEYSKAPEVTRQRLYLETMAEILPKLGNKVILDEAASNVLPFLPLTPGTPARVPAATPSPTQIRRASSN
ncbi:MAG: FtsH protease activity modulator HflK [Verrucomicrobiota bacterium]